MCVWLTTIRTKEMTLSREGGRWEVTYILEGLFRFCCVCSCVCSFVAMFIRSVKLLLT